MSTERCYLCPEKECQPKVFFQINGSAFLQCEHCGLVWLEKDKWHANQRTYYSEQYYPEEYSGQKDFRSLFFYRFRLIKKYFKPQGKMLEVGAASGDFLHLLQDVGYEVYGVELSKRAAEQAARNHNLILSQGTLEEAAFAESSFDYIVMYHVLEHVPDPRAMLKEAFRVLKSGGRILIEVPNVRSIDSLSSPLLLNVLDYPNHIYAFSPRLLKKLVVDAGFKPVVLEGSFPFSFAQFFKKATQLLKTQDPSVKTSDKKPTRITGRELFQQAKQAPLLKRGIQRAIPGMKVTIIGEK